MVYPDILINFLLNLLRDELKMKVTYIESPERLSHQGIEWELLEQQIITV